MVGQTISHYRIVEKLGEGGMGVVYKAEDTQLRRNVALKFLSREALDEEEVAARLVREAQAAASLDHPNICAVHGIHEENGQTFIAMAFIDGPSLAEKIKERPLPLDEALDIASQIAEGLQEAHEKGIVHRDIKPQNIMLTAKGQVKIMDFGLAALSGRSKLTKSGTTLGTPAYMSPEQLEGREVDRRTDVWALGCVLYEMLTQKTPFAADYEQAIGYGILNEEPEPVSAQRADVSPEVDHLIGKALAKSSGNRYQHADDLLVDLHRLQTDSQRPSTADANSAAINAVTRKTAYLRERLAWVLALVLAAGLLWAITRPGTGPEPTLRRVSVIPPAESRFDWREQPALSPDGSMVAFVADDAAGATRLWLRSLESGSTSQVADSSGAASPFWSPDGTLLAFSARGSLRTVDRTGTLARTLTTTTSRIDGGTWSEEGVVLFAASWLDGRLWRTSADGAPAEAVTEVAEGELFHRMPHFLPDGRRYLFVVQAATSEASGLYLGSLDSAEKTKVGDIKSRAEYVQPGYLVFAARHTLMAQPFDLDGGILRGEPRPVGGRVANASNLFGHAAFSAAGGTALAYQDAPQLRLVWFDREGRRLGTINEPGDYASIDLSPDDRMLAYELLDPETHSGDIWVMDVQRAAPKRLTTHADWEMMPAWSSSGDTVMYTRYARLLQTSASGSADEESLEFGTPMAIQAHSSRDGANVVFTSQGDIWTSTLPPGTDADQVTNTRSLEQLPQLSPDGSWIVYTSTETGSPEVYLEDFPGGSVRERVSVRGGTQPRWSREGDEVFYVDPAGRLLAASIQAERALQIGQPHVVIQGPVARGTASSRHRYAIAKQSDRILAIVPDTTIAPAVHLAFNWAQELQDEAK